MKIVVCVKIVKSNLVFGEGDCEDSLFFNPYDLKALEECIRIKKETGASVVCITMGAKDITSVLQKCYALGCDEVILLNDNSFAGSDTIATSYVLAKAIQKIGHVDMIVCGQKSVDGETGQVVYGIGERLGIPVIDNVKTIEEISEKHAIVQKIDLNKATRIAVNYPIITAMFEFSISYPQISLIKLKQSRNKTINCWNQETIGSDPEKCGIKGSRTKVKNIRNVIIRRNQEKVEGSVEDQTAFLLNLLKLERNE